MELQHALSQIADIRQQMSRARQFRGFRSATTLMTALEAQSKLARQAVEQFLPFVIVGGLLTGIMWEYAANALWILPALRQILFGLGLYSLRRIVPMPIAIVGAFYILCGFVNLSASTRFSPWSMSLPFGVGQMLSAFILYWYLERNHAA